MKTPYLFVIDTWESGGEFDMKVLLENEVAGMIVRLNDMSGGHHMDTGFLKQWEQAAQLPVRIPYFVYNPWVNGQMNYDWLISHLPLECGSIMIDLEVAYAGITKEKYASEFWDFWHKVTSSPLNAILYTGAGYLDLLSTWRKDVGYWWAQYPYQFYSNRRMTWGRLRTELGTFDAPTNADKVPGPLKLWQLSGDKIIMEGCSKATDINVWYGSLDEFKAFANNKDVSVTPPTVSGMPVLLSEREYFEGAHYKNYQVALDVQGLTTYHVLEFERSKSSIFVSPYTGNNYVPKMMQKHGMDFGINGDGWFTDPVKKITSIQGWAVSNGQPYGRKGVEETVYVTEAGFTTIPEPAAKMAFSYANVLVKNGVIPTINKADDYRARTAFGWTKDQTKFFIVIVDGKDYYSTEGMTFKETAKIFVDLGCDFACMLDGGGSTTLSVMDNGAPVLLNKSSGEETIAGYPYPMRPVAQLIGVKMTTPPITQPVTEPNAEPVVIPPLEEGAKMYKVLKDIQARPTPSYYNSGEEMIKAGYTFNSLVAVLGSTSPTKPADNCVTFIQIPTGKWLPIVYKGVTYLEIVKENIPSLPPVDETLPPVVIPTYKSAKSLTITFDDGTTKEYDLVQK